MKCLENLVGLSQVDCECNDTPPANFDTSLSGFFIDSNEGVPLRFTDSVTDCGEGGLWDVLNKAREDGIDEFITDVGVYILKRNARMYSDWKGLIGQPKRNNLLTNYDDSGFVGVRVESHAIKGSVYVLNSISFYSATIADDVQVFIVDEGGREVVAPFTITVTAGNKGTHEFTEPLVLPLTDINSQCKEYYIYYDASAYTGAPKDIKTRSSCCGRRASHPYRHIANVYGFDGATDIEDVQYNNQTKSYTYGLSIDGEFRCTFTDWMCQEVSANLSPYMRVAAKCIQLYAVNEVIKKVLNSDKINRYTLLKRDELYHRLNKNTKDIKDRLSWLGENVPYEKVDCMACGAHKSMRRQTLKV